MITSAIALCKASTTKSFKPSCLCYWQVDRKID